MPGWVVNLCTTSISSITVCQFVHSFYQLRTTSLSSSVPLMSLDKTPSLLPASHFPAANRKLTLSQKDALGASTPIVEQHSPRTWLQDRQALHRVKEDCPSALRRCSSALSRPSKIDAPLNFPGPTLRAHVSRERLAPVKPLRALRRVPRNSDLSLPPPMMGSSGYTMAEARELFEQHGIDRPAG